MTFIYPFVFFLFIPLFILYKYETFATNKYKKRARVLLYLSISFAILALSRPVILNTLNKQKFDAQDFIVAIDASYSMQAADLDPTRYIVAKQTLKDIIKAFPKNRFSIFAFTSNAILISPPTTDSAISFMALDSLEPKHILTKGTSLAELLKTVSKTSYEKKSLIIFSDGGEDYDLDTLVNTAKKNNIIPYVVATGSSSGSVLTLNNKNIKDEKNNLVISRINPILKNFASLSGGKYYLLDSPNSGAVQQILSDISGVENQKIEIDVLSYTELFHFVTLLSLLSFLMAVTKIHELYVFIPLLFLPNNAHSQILDFYHIYNANSAFKEANYVQSAKEFDKLTPSVKSYYNKAVAYYKAGEYKKAVQIFATIKTTNPLLKQSIFYNMGNCAVKLGKFQRAKIYYQHALSLGHDDESFYNLRLLYQLNLKEKQDTSNMLPKKEVKKETQADKKEKPQKNEGKQESSKSSSSKSKHEASKSSAGSSDSKGKEKKQALQKTDKPVNAEYKIGYKAYELINKGYTDEKHPW
ncbi:MAG: hypothetical protein AUK54_09450 [Helicobacteraceae bacterium CG2_30_36_10]|nr:MAG: hypothetical protein AUK54_09450 [Helicobacteraceae bacterium CG2_30_36_10]